MGGRGVQARAELRSRLLIVAYPSPVRTRAWEARTDAISRQVEAVVGAARLGNGLTTALFSGTAQADGGHGGAELVAGFGPADGGVVGADQLDAILVEGAVLG